MKKLPSPNEDTPTFDELRVALDLLNPEASARWGTMNSSQMIKHCREFIDLYQGRLPANLVTRVLARMFGGLFLAKMLRKSPLATPKNLGTIPAIRAQVGDELDFEAEKQGLLDGFREIEGLAGMVPHPLYGPTHAEDMQALVRHHTAHHANQFALLDQ